MKSKINAVFVAMLIMVLAVLGAAQSFGVSRDVGQYELFFAEVDLDYDDRFEPLFVYLSIAIKTISDEFSIYLFSLILISLTLKLYVLSKYRYFYLSLFWYLIYLFPVHELTQYRASIALGLLYLSFFILTRDRRKFNAFIIFILSVLFHYSAIAFLPLVFAWHRLARINSVNYFYLIILAAVIVVAKEIITAGVAMLNPTLFYQELDPQDLLNAKSVLLLVIIGLGIFNYRVTPNNIRPFLYISMYGLSLFFIFFDLPIFANRLFEMTIMSYFIWLVFLKGPCGLVGRVLMTTFLLYSSYIMLYMDNIFS